MSSPSSVIIVMGVMGSGKTTVGQRLATRLGRAFYDADDFHPDSNRAKMIAGDALTEADRKPWLATLRREIEQWLQSREAVVLACSALRQQYRDQLTIDNHRVVFVHLTGDPARLLERVTKRTEHFMPAALLDSQLATLEPPLDALTLDIELEPEQLVDKIVQALVTKKR